MTPKPISGRWNHHSLRTQHPRALSDESVREIRWWSASSEVDHLTIAAKARLLVPRYHRSTETLEDVLTRRSYAGIEGPPLTARYWQGREADGLLAWLLWLVLLLAYRAESLFTLALPTVRLSPCPSR